MQGMMFESPTPKKINLSTESAKDKNKLIDNYWSMVNCAWSKV